MSFEPQLVRDLLLQYAPTCKTRVFDPFCGSGVTIVEAKKQGMTAVGVDANPWAVALSSAKTEWGISTANVLSAATELARRARRKLGKQETSQRAARTRAREILDGSRASQDRCLRYLRESGMLERGWMSPLPLARSIYLRWLILQLPDDEVQHLFLLALACVTREDCSNLKAGPEVFVKYDLTDVDTVALWLSKVQEMLVDIDSTSKSQRNTRSAVHLGDSRNCTSLKLRDQFDLVITSPPYPSDHDYTRNFRLELAFLDCVWDVESLRKIKRTMLRSHSKSMYKGDGDADLVLDHPDIARLVRLLKRRAEPRSDGFAKVYPKLLPEYFGGLARHLRGLGTLLPRHGTCILIVADQQSFLNVRVETAKLIATLVGDMPELGFAVESVTSINRIWSSTKRRYLPEHAVTLRRTKRGL